MRGSRAAVWRLRCVLLLACCCCWLPSRAVVETLEMLRVATLSLAHPREDGLAGEGRVGCCRGGARSTDGACSPRSCAQGQAVRDSGKRGGRVHSAPRSKPPPVGPRRAPSRSASRQNREDAAAGRNAAAAQTSCSHSGAQGGAPSSQAPDSSRCWERLGADEQVAPCQGCRSSSPVAGSTRCWQSGVLHVPCSRAAAAAGQLRKLLLLQRRGVLPLHSLR